MNSSRKRTSKGDLGVSYGSIKRKRLTLSSTSGSDSDPDDPQPIIDHHGYKSASSHSGSDFDDQQIIDENSQNRTSNIINNSLEYSNHDNIHGRLLSHEANFSSSKSDSDSDSDNFRPVLNGHDQKAASGSKKAANKNKNPGFTSNSNFERNYAYRRPSPAFSTVLPSDSNSETDEIYSVVKSVKKHSQSKMVNPAERIMAKMGFESGTGLGKNKQGIKEPIKESNQRGRRGLGLKMPKVDAVASEFLPEDEEISVVERVEWLEGCEEPPPSFEELKNYIVIDDKRDTIDGEVNFCDPEVLRGVLNTKTVLDGLEGREKMRARSRANPFESIRKVFFMNRAALKMANMDAVFDFMFTDFEDDQGNKLGENDLLYFADVCAGPGGFSEYVLYRKGWRAKGIGFTLRDDNDFKLHNFFAASPLTFEPYYGHHGDGDVYKPENIDSLYEKVMETTEGARMHFMMADGGFDVEGKENIQEVLSKRLYLCQFLIALRIVRDGGHFVCKLFDLFTPFSAGLVYLMYRCFRRVTIHKPNTSRPANSERYLICKGKRNDIDDVIEYMTFINKKLAKLNHGDEDIRHIYPLEVLTERNSPFFDHLYSTNNRLGKLQICQLRKLVAYFNDPTLTESRAGSLRSECLKLWNIPDRPRVDEQNRHPSSVAQEYLGASHFQTKMKIKVLDGGKPMDRQLKSAVECYCCVTGSSSNDGVSTPPSIFIAQGRGSLFQFDTATLMWTPVSSPFRLPSNTIVLGEIVKFCKGGAGNQQHVPVFHIIDGAVLSGENIQNKSLEERLKLCDTFARALHTDSNLIFAKETFLLDDIDKLFRNLSERMHKNGKMCVGYGYDEKFIKPSGVLFLGRSKEFMMRAYSKSNKREYLYDVNTKKTFMDPNDMQRGDADFMETFKLLKMWDWDGVRILKGMEVNSEKIQKEEILKFVNATGRRK